MRPAPPLEIDFQAVPRPRAHLAGIVIALLGLAATVGALEIKSVQDASLRSIRAEHDRLRDSLHPARPLVGIADPQTERQLRRAAGVLDALALPWDDLLAMVEGAGSRGIGLLSLMPDPATQTVRVSGEAKSLGEALDYLARLSSQPSLTDVVLVSYSTVQREGVAAVEFTLSAKWNRS